MIVAHCEPRSSHRPIGEHLRLGLPLAIEGAYPSAVAAPARGDHTAADVLRNAGVTNDEINALFDAGTIA